MDLILQQKFEKLVSGKAAFTSHNLGFNLLMSRLKKNYSANQTPAGMRACIQEIDAFYTKYGSIMTDELDAIKKL